MSALLALLQVIPKLIDLAMRLGEQVKQARFDEWLADVDSTIQKLEHAQTPEEKRNAAVDVARIIAGRRP